jgi:teichuronic acid exporter
VLGVIAGLPFGVLGPIWSQVIVSIISFFIIGHYTGKMINYSAWKQTLDILPMLGVALVVAVVMYLLDSFINNTSDIMRILIGAVMSIILYLGLSYIFKFESLLDLRQVVTMRRK